MEFIYVGEIVSTHGLKGEIKITSSFPYKDMIFKEDFKLYVGKRKEELCVITHRIHKNYDMVTLKGITNIEDAIAYKGDAVYVNREDIKIDGYLNEDLIGLNVYTNNKLIGQIETIMDSAAHDILVIKSEGKKHLVPYIDEFVKTIDIENKRIDIKVIEGLLNDN